MTSLILIANSRTCRDVLASGGLPTDTQAYRSPGGASQVCLLCGLNSAVVACPPSKRKVPGSIPGGSQRSVWRAVYGGLHNKDPRCLSKRVGYCTRQRVPNLGKRAVMKVKCMRFVEPIWALKRLPSFGVEEREFRWAWDW